jgi:hypothetical protein
MGRNNYCLRFYQTSVWKDRGNGTYIRRNDLSPEFWKDSETCGPTESRIDDFLSNNPIRCEVCSPHSPKHKPHLFSKWRRHVVSYTFSSVSEEPADSIFSTRESSSLQYIPFKHFIFYETTRCHTPESCNHFIRFPQISTHHNRSLDIYIYIYIYIYVAVFFVEAMAKTYFVHACALYPHNKAEDKLHY